MKKEPGRWHNDSVFVFCEGDCSFESKASLTSADACGEVTSCAGNHQEVSMCSTGGGSHGKYITFTSAV